MKNKENRPLWFKLWAEDAEELIHEGLEDAEDEKEKNIIFEELGRALYYGLLFHKQNAEEKERPRFKTLEAKGFYKMLKRWSADSFDGFEERAERNRINGKKGGRPKGKIIKPEFGPFEEIQEESITTEEPRQESTEELSTEEKKQKWLTFVNGFGEMP